jgi:hypothetical protein
MGFKQIPVIGPVEHDGCPQPHTPQKDRHIQRPGQLVPEFVGGGQNTARRLSVFAQTEHYFQSVHPVFTPHFSDRNYPGSFDHFFTAIILCYQKYLPGIQRGIGVLFENLYFVTTFNKSAPAAGC